MDNDNNDENLTDIVNSVDKPTDDLPESFAPTDSIPSLSRSEPFKRELIDTTNNNESGGSSNGFFCLLIPAK